MGRWGRSKESEGEREWCNYMYGVRVTGHMQGGIQKFRLGGANSRSKSKMFTIIII